jgi:hypothetical protein
MCPSLVLQLYASLIFFNFAYTVPLDGYLGISRYYDAAASARVRSRWGKDQNRLVILSQDVGWSAKSESVKPNIFYATQVITSSKLLIPLEERLQQENYILT